MKNSARKKRFNLSFLQESSIYKSLFFLIFLLNCNKTEETPSEILTKFFYLINEGSYRKASSFCLNEIDPELLDFTNVVTLRFIDRVVVQEKELNEARASFYVFLFLKDGKELGYYQRTEEGDLVPGVMELRRVTLGDSKYGWRLKCDEFWETYHWQDITRKIRLDIITLTEEVLRYRDSSGSLPEKLRLVLTERIDSIINPVTGDEMVFVPPEKIKPGTVSFYYNKEKDEVEIKGYDVLGEQIDFFIVSSSSKTEKAHLLEFFDVPPRTITTVIPAYPESEREEGLEGVVSLRLLIGRDGMVKEVKVEKHLSPVFDSLAVEAVKQSVFSPAKRNDRPVAVWYYFPVRFVLEKFP